MKSIQVFAALCALAFALGRPATLTPTGPMGSYCGSYDGILSDLNMTTIGNNTFSISAKVFGVHFGCPKEQYTYYPTNSSIYFPGIFNATDCVGKIASNAGLDPTDFVAQYPPRSNSLCASEFSSQY
eukprot:m.122535 g.122535  ORF g.122535 m.122535 type:complete len:127 (-) comp13421_c1_seq1:1466-1846(-)